MPHKVDHLKASTGIFSGNVGIGTTSPSYKLHVSGDINFTGALYQNGTAFSGGGGSSVWSTSGSNIYYTAGKVGLGVTNPGVTLDILKPSSYTPRLRFGSSSSFSDDELFAISFGATSTSIGVHSSARGVFGRQGIAIHTANTQEFGVKTDGWTNLFAIDCNSKNAYFAGKVGIGTTNPGCSLAVYSVSNGSVTGSNNRSYFYRGSTSLSKDTSPGSGDICIYSQGWVHSTEGFIATNGTLNASDKRIKKNIVDVDDAECLETLRLLKPKKYQYKDEINRGQEPVWGFIAQEVRDILPYATQLRQDVLPNIYELANVSLSNVITFVNFNTSNLESNATTLIRTKGIDGEDHDVHLVEVIDEHTIRVKEDLSDWIGSVDETGNAINEITTTTLSLEEYEALEDKSGCVANITGYRNANVVVSIEEYNALEDTTGYEEVVQDYTKTTTTYTGTQLFVYGQEVDDFIFVKKEAIWTVTTAALQEVDRQQQADKLRITELESQVADLLARVTALENI
jgi:hypothetical protein